MSDSSFEKKIIKTNIIQKSSTQGRKKLNDSLGSINLLHNTIRVGNKAGKNLVEGDRNSVIVGHAAACQMMTGRNNVMIGYHAGKNGSYNGKNTVIGTEYISNVNNREFVEVITSSIKKIAEFLKHYDITFSTISG